MQGKGSVQNGKVQSKMELYNMFRIRDDLPKLKYLTMCLKEVLRLHTPVPFIERQVTKDIEIEGHLVPAGTLVDIQLYVLHHSPGFWQDPEEFRPERFSPENQANTDHYAFLPFSAGPRFDLGPFIYYARFLSASSAC